MDWNLISFNPFTTKGNTARYRLMTDISDRHGSERVKFIELSTQCLKILHLSLGLDENKLQTFVNKFGNMVKVFCDFLRIGAKQ